MNITEIMQIAAENGSMRVDLGADGCGYDLAIIGITQDFKLIYCADKMVELLAAEEEISLSDAQEFLEYNTFSAYVGEMTPIFAYSRNDEEIEISHRKDSL